MTGFNNRQASSDSYFLILLIALILVIAGLAAMLLMQQRSKSGGNAELIAIEEHIAPKSHPKVVGILPGESYEFDDGLRNPVSSKKIELDEFGEGIASQEIFEIDVNKEGLKDKITKTRYENGTDHFYYSYKIEVNRGDRFEDITPNDFRTVEGADCSLQKLRFVFSPSFSVIKISRGWEESWVTPTVATKIVYGLKNDRLEIIKSERMEKICDVSSLFQ